MVAELPPEIWYHIISFLPRKILQRLYAVNRIFFDVVMRKKYCEVTIGSIHDNLQRILESIQNPTIAQYVKTVYLSPDAPQEKYSSTMIERFFLFAATSTRSGQNAPYSSPSFNNSIQTQSLTAFHDLVHLENLHIKWKHLEAFPAMYMHSFWPTLAPRLKALTITTESTWIRTVIPPPSVKFARLASFSLTITHSSNALSEDPSLSDSLSSVAAFLNTLQDTLESLYIRPTPSHDLSDLWEPLGHFSHLKDLNVDLSAPPPRRHSSFNSDQQTFWHPCHDFLFRHRVNIENLTCASSRLRNLNPRDQLVDTPFFPKLRSLSMESSIFTGRRRRIEEYLLHQKCTLQSFEILGELSPDEADEMLTVLAGRPRFSNITVLSISIYKLDLDFLRKLSTKLPALKSLKLRIVCIANGTSPALTPGQFFPLRLPPKEDVHQFVSDMVSSLELRNWRLKNITIIRVSCCSDMTLWNLMQLFAFSIPSITGFSDTGCMDIPDLEELKAIRKARRCSDIFGACFYGQDGVDGLSMG